MTVWTEQEMPYFVGHGCRQNLLLVDVPSPSEIERALVEDHGVLRGFAVYGKGDAKRIIVYGYGLCHGCGKEFQD